MQGGLGIMIYVMTLALATSRCNQSFNVSFGLLKVLIAP